MNLISGKIYNNTASEKGNAIYHSDAELNLNGEKISIDGSVSMGGDGTNGNYFNWGTFSK